ncbi:hypothetical protein ATCC90586_005904 [Pythium insidiosum]|nr:hypothetical protein ATCC90586_005904 [Pythium insidiosum]
MSTSPAARSALPQTKEPHDAAVATDPDLVLSFLPSETLVWQQGPVIASGRFGVVRLGIRVPSTELLAVKQMYIQEEIDQGNDTSSLSMQRVQPLQRIEREVKIVSALEPHPHVVRFYGCERRGPIYNIFMEYVEAGALSRLAKELGPFDELTTQRFVRHVTLGVAYLHRIGIAHRDLKCANLLLTGDGVVKIADFGTAKQTQRRDSHVGGAVGDGDDDDDAVADEFMQEQETARSVREGLGSPYWMAPEIVRAERGPDGWQKADVWGIGCVMIELLTGRPPWHNHSNPLTAMFHIASRDAIPPIPPRLSDNAREFLLACFQKDPSRRPTASNLLRHPYLQVQEPHDAECRADVEPPHSLERLVPPVSGRGQSVDAPPSPASASSASDRVASSTTTSPRSGASEGESPPADPDFSSDEEDEQEPEPVAAASATPTNDSVNAPVPRDSIVLQTTLGVVRAIASYDAADPSELSLADGEIVAVVDVNEFGWWRGRREGSSGPDVGWFPCTYVEWQSVDKQFAVRRAHRPSATGMDRRGSVCERPELAVEVDDLVLISQCEWMDECLWALGSLPTGHCGWFPFACVLDKPAPGGAAQR